MVRRVGWRVLFVLVLFGGALAGGVPASRGAVVPGQNGPILLETPTDLRTFNPDETLTILVGTSGADDSPAFAPFNAFVVFENGGQIVRANADGTGRTTLTSLTPADATRPRVHPSGTKIIFVRPTGLFEVPATGGAATQVTGTVAGDAGADYSPNPNVVGYDASGIFRTDENGGSKTRLQGTLSGDANPVVSPDNMFVTFNASGGSIVRLPWPNGGPRTTLTGTIAGDTSPSISPQGDMVAFYNATSSFALPFPNGGGRRDIAAGVDPFYGYAMDGVIPPVIPPVIPGSAPIFGSNVPCNSTILAKPYHLFKLPIGVSDPDFGSEVTLADGDLPHGAKAYPHLPLTGNPVSTTVYWFPHIWDWGNHPVSFSAASQGQTTLCPFNIRVGLHEAA